MSAKNFPSEKPVFVTSVMKIIKDEGLKFFRLNIKHDLLGGPEKKIQRIETWKV